MKLVNLIVVVDATGVLADWRVNCEAPTILRENTILNAPDPAVVRRTSLKQYTEMVRIRWSSRSLNKLRAVVAVASSPSRARRCAAVELLIPLIYILVALTPTFWLFLFFLCAAYSFLLYAYSIRCSAASRRRILMINSLNVQSLMRLCRSLFFC